MFSNFDPMTAECAFPIVKETVPASRLGYSTNNIYDGFPPLMNDGRSITAAFQPQSVVNDQILQDSGIQTNWQYRKYLSENGKKIMERNFRDACNDVGYVERYVGESVPTATSRGNLQNKDSDLKEMYLSREQLNSRLRY